MANVTTTGISPGMKDAGFPHRCSFCKKSFRKYATFIRHIQKAHK